MRPTRRHRRHADGRRRPPRGHHCPPRQLHGGKLRDDGRWPRRNADQRSASAAAAVDEPAPRLTRSRRMARVGGPFARRRNPIRAASPSTLRQRSQSQTSSICPASSPGEKLRVHVRGCARIGELGLPGVGDQRAAMAVGRGGEASRPCSCRGARWWPRGGRRRPSACRRWRQRCPNRRASSARRRRCSADRCRCCGKCRSVAGSTLPPLGTVGSVISTVPPAPEVMTKLPAE